MPGEEEECFNGESAGFAVLTLGVCALSCCNLLISSSFFAILCLSTESCGVQGILQILTLVVKRMVFTICIQFEIKSLVKSHRIG